MLCPFKYPWPITGIACKPPPCYSKSDLATVWIF